MEIFGNKVLFSFKYNGIPFGDLHKSTSQYEKDGETVSEHILADGLRISSVFIKTGSAYTWVNWLENTGSSDSGLITELCDCDVPIPFDEDKRPFSKAFVANGADTVVYSPTGSTWDDMEFCCDVEKISSRNQRFASIYPGESKYYSTTGGRSSQSKLPFFNINRREKGVIFAIGWTGQWFCRLERSVSDIRIATGIEELSFVLHPGEKIRTSSIVIMTYENGIDNAHNEFRKVIRDYYSQIGGKRAKHAPLSFSMWGGLSSYKMVARINKASEKNLGFEFAWVDAGWYGPSGLPCPNEFEGDWGVHTGDWTINKTYHPDGFREVVKALKDNGLRFILWFEPERVVKNTPITKEHPEFFLSLGDSGNLLLDLGRRDAWEYCFNLLKEKIRELNIGCYRQDFNFDPLEYWRQNDEPNRKGIHEIKHIMGLYRLWDELLREFPGLIIDNCASGGRRIDIETLRRSTPLWRSDYQCPANHDPDIAQNHTLALSRWIPFHGTSIGRTMNDTYHARSCYTTALGNNFLFSEMEDENQVSEQTFDWIRSINEEYKAVRELMEHDFYPLTSTTTDKQSWCAMQFEYPEEGRGVILAFRRSKSPYNSAVFNLGGIKNCKTYTFTDKDSGEKTVINGTTLINDGFNITIDTKRESKLLFYSY